MQYLQPAERLATCEIRRLSLRSTLPDGSQIAALICVKACTIFDLRCMISTLLGMNPHALARGFELLLQLRCVLRRQRRKSRRGSCSLNCVCDCAWSVQTGRGIATWFVQRLRARHDR